MLFTKTRNLSLSAMLFVAGATSALAQEVILGDGSTKVNWADFVSAVNDPSTIEATADSTALKAAIDAQKKASEAADAALQAYTTASNDLTTWQAQLAVLNASKPEPLPWLAEEQAAALEFQKAFHNLEVDEFSNTVDVWYYVTSGIRKTLYISFIDPKDSKYSPVKEREFFDNMDQYTTFSAIKVYLGKNAEGEYNYNGTDDDGCASAIPSGDAFTWIDLAVNAIDAVVKSGDYDKNTAEKEELIEKINGLATPDEDGVTGLQKLSDESTEAQKALTEANTALTNAQAEYDKAQADAEANAVAKYDEITLEGDVTTDATVKDYKGTINGNGHVITYTGENALFNVFSGNLGNVAVNGKFANMSSGSRGTVANWTGTTGTYITADNVRSEYSTLGALGFAARENFGANLAEDALAVKTEESVVYDITVYTPTSNNQQYVNLKNGKFVNKATVEVGANTFVETQTGDEAIVSLNNVIFDGECQNVVIEDKAAFYCPMELTATNVTLNREFKEGYNTVVLPFDVESTPEAVTLCTYDRETIDKFWFTKVAGTVEANTPMLLVVAEGTGSYKFDDLSNVHFAATPKNQIVMDEGSADEASKSYGVFKTVGPDEFDGGFQSYKIYGLQGNDFQAAGANAKFNPFRMVISSELGERDAQKAPRRIGILDSKGIEITDQVTGIAAAEIDATSAFEIAGGHGEIIFNADANYGKVEVYSIDGSVAAVANVVEGTTSVDVQSGIYIVMGKKVMVK